MIPTELRRTVLERAGSCCEYCLLNQADIFFAFEVDHIISLKHDGPTVSDNLCLSCPDCNRYKGSDIGSIDPQTQAYTPLFNPRTQVWEDHFRLDGPAIEPLTGFGRVTVKLLRLNAPERIQDRELYTDLGGYPCRPTSA